jgi:peptidoglycan hydrolase-like protein with peptidoglycan-binding domain
MTNRIGKHIASMPQAKAAPTSVRSQPTPRVSRDELSTGKSLALRNRLNLLEGAGPTWPVGPLAPNKTPRDDVKVMQQKLVQLGFLDAATVKGFEGVYGQATQEAVRRFQGANALVPADGQASKATLRQLGSPGALTTAQALAAADQAGTTIIVPSIGVAAEGDAPHASDLASTTITTTRTAANVREGPGTTQTKLGTFPPNTVVTVVQPQPGGGTAGWLSVQGTANGKTLQGWVAHGVNGIDVLKQQTSPDPRVQARMEQLGFCAPGYPCDETTIKDFQRVNGRPVTGTLDDDTLSTMWAADAKVSTEIRQVTNPNYNPSTNAPSSSNDCGPTSVAMALASVGLLTIDNADPEAAIKAMRTLTGGTSSDTTGPGQLKTAITGGGGQPYDVKSLDELKLALAHGDPVVAFNDNYHGHWYTVTGYDPQSGKFLVNDPMSKTGTAWLAPSEMKLDFGVPSVAVHRP